MGETHPLLRIVAALVLIACSILYLADGDLRQGAPRLFAASGMGGAACQTNALLISTRCKSQTGRNVNGAVFVSATYR
ncbi:hypothetical protein [Anianabacter salinae]|uniref:hypothetical protein n=1 Tax=Anianabacter salinae TaxID=2851023 RepID=UPI00225E04F0|nr:hypothetical protein [Anianabacter salinae]MBV0910820.1 hypothetical protein [Anianabacter salinae]